MSDELSGIVPGVPFIPDRPPTEIVRIIAEWVNRADLAATAQLDGLWRTLTDYPTHTLIERWIEIPDDPDHIMNEVAIIRKQPA